eukprot:TRINITY_DN30932_c0_g1_i1.p1 TRINITY_DN30932_c0_g1~~TRINITY_DN30932_c0_g1_i1.p1  ORF type:complete len:333 (+),score=140.71 TRINITY_DN30932_c0_g1_i1:74-1072(+)
MSSYMRAAARCDLSNTKDSPVALDERELLEEQMRGRDVAAVSEQLARDRALLDGAAETAARRERVAAKQSASARAANVEAKEQAQARRRLEAQAASAERTESLRQEAGADAAADLEAKADGDDCDDSDVLAERRAAAAASGSAEDGPLYRDNARFKSVGGQRVKKQHQEMERKLAERRRRQQQECEDMTRQQRDDSDEEAEVRRVLHTQRAKEAEARVAEARNAQAREAELAAREEEDVERRRARVHAIDILQRQIAADLIAEREREVADIDEQGDTDWVGKLEQYLDVERDAWREHAALERAEVSASGSAQVTHAEAVAMARRQLAAGPAA